MGWTSSDDPFAQVRLSFPTLAAAVQYAERQGLDYRVVESPVKRWRRKSYPDTRAGAATGSRLHPARRETGRSGEHDPICISEATYVLHWIREKAKRNWRVMDCRVSA